MEVKGPFYLLLGFVLPTSSLRVGYFMMYPCLMMSLRHSGFLRFLWWKVIGSSSLTTSYHSSLHSHYYPTDRIPPYLTYLIHFLPVSCPHLGTFWTCDSEMVVGIDPETLSQMSISLGKIKYNSGKKFYKIWLSSEKILHVSQTSGKSVVRREIYMVTTLSLTFITTSDN